MRIQLPNLIDKNPSAVISQLEVAPEGTGDAKDFPFLKALAHFTYVTQRWNNETQGSPPLEFEDFLRASAELTGAVGDLDEDNPFDLIDQFIYG